MTEAMPFLQKYDITFLRPPTIWPGLLFIPLRAWKILFELASVLISAILQTRYKTYIRSYGAIR